MGRLQINFKLSEEQQNKLEKWQKKQLKKNPYVDSFGYRFEYRFAPTGIGDNVIVVDMVTKDELVLTEED